MFETPSVSVSVSVIFPSDDINLYDRLLLALSSVICR